MFTPTEVYNSSIRSTECNNKLIPIIPHSIVSLETGPRQTARDIAMIDRFPCQPCFGPQTSISKTDIEAINWNEINEQWNPKNRMPSMVFGANCGLRQEWG